MSQDIFNILGFLILLIFYGIFKIITNPPIAILCTAKAPPGRDIVNKMTTQKKKGHFPKNT